jgi:hypothetical protein
MTLQVRLVHALGDRLIDLPEKTHDAPLVIGRATTADIQVPATTVSRRHSLLYVRDGQWYIQDGNGGARTLVNGKPTPKPTPVHSGDVVALGTEPSPPTLTIDPYGLLAMVETPHATETAPEPVEANVPPQAPKAKRFPAPAAPVPSRASVPQPAGWPQQPTQIAAEHAVPAGHYDEPPEPAADPVADDWMAAAPVDLNYQRYYVPKKNTWSVAIITTVVFCGIGIIGGAAYLYYKRDTAARQEAERLNRAATQQVIVIKKQANNVFEDQQALKRRAIEEATTKAAAPKVASVESTAAQDPGRQTEEWRSVKEAHDSRPPIEAIVIFGDYMKQFPSSPYAADVRKYTEDALDTIWWDHIVELAKERDDANKEIVAKNRDIAQSADPEFKKSLQDEKAVWEEKLQQANDKLKEMNYASETKPNIYDTALMAELRRARNPVLYDGWKKGAEQKIKESRGQKPVW